jgi:DNA-binding transcriptional ArsR family regulator
VIGDFQPVEVRIVSDAGALKALADPLRLHLLEVLAMDDTRSWTVKELAAEMGQPVTRLYHHMKLLEAAELVHDAETRIVSGIVEHRYRCAQRSIKLDERMFGAAGTREATIATVSGVIEQTREDLEAYLERDDSDPDLVSIGRAVSRLTEDERVAVMASLEAVIDGIAERRDAQDRTGLPRSAVTFVMHPVADAPAG